MSLPVGFRLGPYEIESLVGAGGMGEVYRARDSRLNRTVAIKVLPPDSNRDEDRRRRFAREARIIAGLNHPHICTLYDVGRQDTIDFLVMEYVEGETLARRLERGSGGKGPAFRLEDALRLAIEIAGALEAAHRQAVVHRDLKPANIMLTAGGAKLLDFGIAKFRASAEGPGTMGLGAPTRTASLTGEFTVMGTLPYMAPEQIEGKPADARTDLFAFGAVLYEMVTGHRAFAGESQASVIAAILERDPPPIPPQLGEESGGSAHLEQLDRIIRACLAKQPDDRWQTARDLRRELEWVAERRLTDTPAAPAESRSGLRRQTWVAASLLGAAIVGGLVGWSFSRSAPQPDPPPIVRSVIPLEPSGLSETGLMAISPDGSRLVYVARRDGERSSQLYVRRLDQQTAVPIDGTEFGRDPFFSHDGQWVGFFSGNPPKLRKVSLSGGVPVTLCDAPLFRGATWGASDEIVFSSGGTLGVWSLFRVPASGGTPTLLASPDRAKREKGLRFPELLPGGRALLLTSVSADISSGDDGRIELLVLETGERRVLIEGGTYPKYSPTGHLIYARAGRLMAAPFDLTRLTITGAPMSVADSVVMVPSSGYGTFSFSNDGTLAYLSGGEATFDSALVWLNRKGEAEPLTARQRPFSGPRLSPDGRHVAVQLDLLSNEVWVHDTSRETLTRLAFGWNNTNPIWTPDGERVTFSSQRDGPNNVYWQQADGSGPAERLTTNELWQVPGSWSPDGKLLAYTQISPRTGSDVWILPMDDRGNPYPLLQETFNELSPRFSPDGRWLAYVTNESGNRLDVYVRPFPGPGRRWQISTGHGEAPVWARDGRELFYLTNLDIRGDGLMAVPVNTGSSFSAGKPSLLFKRSTLLNGYDVTPDGTRFLAISDPVESPRTELHVVQNWFEELRQRASAER